MRSDHPISQLWFCTSGPEKLNHAQWDQPVTRKPGLSGPILGNFWIYLYPGLWLWPLSCGHWWSLLLDPMNLVLVLGASSSASVCFFLLRTRVCERLTLGAWLRAHWSRFAHTDRLLAAPWPPASFSHQQWPILKTDWTEQDLKSPVRLPRTG